MAAPAIPQQFSVQTANQVNLVSWALVSGASSYVVQSSLDNVTYSTLVTLSGSPLATSYTDTSAALGVQVWYQVASANSSGTSPFTTPASAIPTPTGEMSLSSIRLAAQQRADRVNSNFVTNAEWRAYINQSMFELYDILVTLYEDYYVAQPVQFTTNGTLNQYKLPDGTLQFLNPNTNATGVARPYYKLLGVDMALNSAPNGYVTVNKFNFIDRNRFVYPNTASTIYGVFNCQYRQMGNYLEFIPTPSGNQSFRVWYIPRLIELLQETDTTDIGVSGWTEYIIVKAAYYALTKEESDTSSLVMQLQALTDRITSSAANRDAGQADTISDTRSGGWGRGGAGGGFNGASGGF